MKERLDRAFVNFDCSNLFNHIRIRHLAFRTSDHLPILIELEEQAGKWKWVKRKRRFFFESFWKDHEGCEEGIKKAWEGEGNVNQKLNVVSNSLLNWSNQTFGHIPSWIRKVQDKMEVVQNQASSNEADKQLDALANELDELLEQK